jgi:DNA-binding LytR/AlgR family response regulator
MKKANILIVEDEAIVAVDLYERLLQMGYDVEGIVDNGEDAIELALDKNIDVLILDINLAGPISGIDAAKEIMKIKPIPVIYVTAYLDNKTFENALKTYPFAYIVKPFEDMQLFISIEIAVNNSYRFSFNQKDSDKEVIEVSKNPIKQDFFFVKKDGKYVRINISDVLWFDVSSNYTTIFTKTDQIQIPSRFSNFAEELNCEDFVRVHKSYAVNINQITSFDENNLQINDIEIPIGRVHKAELMERLKII